MEPITNEEKYLAALTGESVVLPDPITRKEIFLAAAAGVAVSVPDPITREEMYLSQIKPGDGSGVVIKNQNKTITENGSYRADSGYTGLGTVTVAVPIPEVEEPVLEPLTVTENGEYTPDEGVDGFDKVTVEVEGNGTAEMEFVHIEDWTTDAMGNAVSFGNAYFEPYISSYPAAGIATIEGNTYSGDYAGVAIGLIYLSANERYGYARRSKNVNSGTLGLSFHIGAQSMVKVKVMQLGGVE